jgi:hypothetical protein
MSNCVLSMINYEMCFNFVIIILAGRYDRILFLLQIFLNPLYLVGSRITSPHFDTKVRVLSRKYLQCEVTVVP